MYVPAAQSVQTASPAAVLYLPATHATHGEALEARPNPAAHMQASWAVAPPVFWTLVYPAPQARQVPLSPTEYWPTGQSPQVAWEVAGVKEPVPAAHATQASTLVEPVFELKVPAGQEKHPDPIAVEYLPITHD